MHRLLAPLVAGCVVLGAAAATTGAAGAATSGVEGAPRTVAAPATTPPSRTAARSASRIHWGSCASSSLQAAHAQCGYVAVPLDYAHPDGRQIRIAVSRVRHLTTASGYQGVMLVNPGGPGGSGLGLATLGKYVPKHAGDAYDWIGFDPRGVGSSKPALSCLPNYFHGDRPPYVPVTPELLHTWLSRSKAYARACGQDQPALLEHMKTTDSARDMDRIRMALGAQRINYYGFSYGTYLGQVYATLFPSRLRRTVLDSNVNPRRVWYRANLDQDLAFERNIRIWFGWVAKYDSVYHLGATQAAVQKNFYRQKYLLKLHPAGGVVGPDEWTDIFLYAGYYQFTWTYLADVFSGWVNHHQTAKLVKAFKNAEGVGNDNGYAVYLAVQCTDVQWPQRWSTWQRDNWATYQKAPFETWANAWFNAPCLYWPAKAGTPTRVTGNGTRMLLIDETLDAATPYQGSLVVRNLFPNSRLIAEPGGVTHAGSLYGNACVDNKIADYLASGRLPADRAGSGADTFCKPLPRPKPGDRSAGAATRVLPRIM